MTWAPLFLSLEIATLAMVMSLVLGTSLAVLLNWKKLPGRDLWYAVVCAPLVLPPTVLGYYLLVALGRESAIGRAWQSLTGSTIVFSFTGAVIAAAIGSLPLVVRAARIGLESVDANLVAAARTLGARPLRVLFTIVLPLAAPAIIAGAMLAFARALGDYGITQMVAGQMIDGTETASIHVMNALYGGREVDARNMAIVTTIVGVAMMYLANRVLKRFAGGHV
ncbi:MAG: molybdate ABC transporter permease subunit [Kofleriaceae bacterium]|nr:molybdate ABC transporter permease subunit [Kofleriaceae bacterium]